MKINASLNRLDASLNRLHASLYDSLRDTPNNQPSFSQRGSFYYASPDDSLYAPLGDSLGRLHFPSDYERLEP